jgi:hypothetical protein
MACQLGTVQIKAYTDLLLDDLLTVNLQELSTEDPSLRVNAKKR